MKPEVTKKELKCHCDSDLLAKADKFGIWLWLEHGWANPISVNLAKDYAKRYDSSNNDNNSYHYGFYDIKSHVQLTHEHAKFIFSKAEAAEIINLIKVASKEIW